MQNMPFGHLVCLIRQKLLRTDARIENEEGWSRACKTNGFSLLNMQICDVPFVAFVLVAETLFCRKDYCKGRSNNIKETYVAVLDNQLTIIIPAEINLI